MELAAIQDAHEQFIAYEARQARRAARQAKIEAWPTARYEDLFDLGCRGFVFTVVASAGVAAHRAPWCAMRTLCGIDFDRSWEPGIAAVTCEECNRQSREAKSLLRLRKELHVPASA